MTSRASIELSGHDLKRADLISITSKRARVTLNKKSLVKVEKSRECIDTRLKQGIVSYGINTGFGYLKNVTIPHKDLVKLQQNLIRSHACGVGDPLSAQEVRAVLTLRLQTMLRGNSGVAPTTISFMKDLLNSQVVPYVPSKGSVGASGDLAPLAHIALTMLGEGKAYYRGDLIAAREALKRAGLKPITPQAKEGLCLINGTQVMTALGLLACAQIDDLIQIADIAASLSIEALRGTSTAFRSEIHAVRPHPGQVLSAKRIWSHLQKSAIAKSHEDCEKVQDPYSLRCSPQVHGAAIDTLNHAEKVLLIEANSSTDNPLVFSDTNEILSGGNFHGQPVALVLDFLAIALSEIGSISERRVDKLVNPHMSGLSAFLTKNPGLNSGFMIPQVVAAALVNENKVLSHPASVDSISTSAEQEDHVSMGMTSALKLKTIIKNVAYGLAIELIAASQGVDLLKPLKPGRGALAAYKVVRQFSERMDEDRSLHKDFEVLAPKLLSGEFLELWTKAYKA